MAFPRVSDLRFLTGTAKRPAVLYSLSIVMSLATLLAATQFAPWLDHRIAHPLAAWGIVALQLALVALAAYLVAMTIGSLSFGEGWRDRYLVTYTPLRPKDPESYLERIADKTLPFWTFFVGAFAVLAVSAHMAGGGYLFQFTGRGYALAEFRSSSPTSQVKGMRAIVANDLDRFLAPDALRERLRTLLVSDSPAVTAQAAWTAGRLKLVSLDRALHPLLDHADDDTRIEAAIAIGQLATSAGIRALDARFDTLIHHPGTDEAVLVALGLTRRPEAGRTIAAHFTSIPDDVRHLAVWAMGESEDLCTQHIVLRETDEDRPLALRCAAMNAMKRLSSVESVETLNQRFLGDDPWCPLEVWKGRSAILYQHDFYRIVTSAERFHEKTMDALFNAAAPDLRDWLTDIVNDTTNSLLDRKHARELYDYIATGMPRTARKAGACSDPVYEVLSP